jgi:hypothetical protein
MAGFALCIAVVMLGGCGSGSPRSSSSTTSVAAVSSTTLPAGGPAEMALAAYRGMWADMVIASRTSDYQSPLLPQHASGAALSLLIQGLAKNQESGIVTKGQPTLHPQVTSLTPEATPTQATITDCVNDTHWLDYKSTGGLLNATPGGRHATTAIVTEAMSNWTVTKLAVQGVGTC